MQVDLRQKETIEPFGAKEQFVSPASRLKRRSRARRTLACGRAGEEYGLDARPLPKRAEQVGREDLSATSLQLGVRMAKEQQAHGLSAVEDADVLERRHRPPAPMTVIGFMVAP